MRFALTIEIDQNAMRTGADVAAALRWVATELANHSTQTLNCEIPSVGIRDENGDLVGSWSVAEPESLYDILIRAGIGRHTAETICAESDEDDGS
jgi:hypothetical protein